jgi:hypothetical protein
VGNSVIKIPACAYLQHVSGQHRKPTPEKITKNIVSIFGNFNYLCDVLQDSIE